MSVRPARKTLALLTDTLNSEYTTIVRAAVAREAARRDVNLLVFMGQRMFAPAVIEATQNRIYEYVTGARVDGVIVCASTVAHYAGVEGLRRVCAEYAPLPVCSLGVEVPGVPSIVVDNVASMELCVRHLIEAHGRRRIAFVGGQQTSPESNHRLEGYRQALALHGLPFDERLVEYGEFTVRSGKAAMRRLLDKNVSFDAVVAANDYMAMAATGILQEHQVAVPKQVLVTGVDDVRSASWTQPSLSTLRQPLWTLGAQAVTVVMDQLDGKNVDACHTFRLDLVLRESCGCQSHAAAVTLPPTSHPPPSLSNVLTDTRHALENELSQLVQVPNGALGRWSARLLDALTAELGPSPGVFLQFFDQLLSDAQELEVNLHEFQHVITRFRAELSSYSGRQVEFSRRLEHLWDQCRLRIGSAAISSLGRWRIEEQQATALLGRSGERFSTTLSLPLLAAALKDELPMLGIQDAAVSLFEDATHQALKPLMLIHDGALVPQSGATIAPAALAPDLLLSQDHRYHHVVLPLTFESDLMGIAVLEGSAVPSVYSALRQQIGAAVKCALLHRQVVEHVALRERAERERLVEEARLAREIQASMNPALLQVTGLDIAATMIPAAEAGGDYYDVIADQAGAWFGIGDVTGHGITAGIVMVILQSLIGGMVRLNPRAAPSQVVQAVNEGLYDAIRQRLGRDDHATLALIRYQPHGKLSYAGAHEPFIVYRKRTQRCELVDPGGFWVGAVPDIGHLTEDGSLQLEAGDLLVLYTDGLVEPRNAYREQFGLERLMAAVEQAAHQTVTEIREHLLQTARAWSSDWDDDVTLVVIRYRGE